ncbi:hypothetical protein SEVIR_4G170201v4 [Setaria viridis]|uniref:Uncharacterized protein n=1 Tax=Setaria viridis TaxID=4556 RepID=A0A4U6UX52_SETVI|nr:hypothetical protein SEVIR_4G170201v2 [Setaria viridis]
MDPIYKESNPSYLRSQVIGPYIIERVVLIGNQEGREFSQPSCLPFSLRQPPLPPAPSLSPSCAALAAPSSKILTHGIHRPGTSPPCPPPSLPPWMTSASRWLRCTSINKLLATMKVVDGRLTSLENVPGEEARRVDHKQTLKARRRQMPRPRHLLNCKSSRWPTWPGARSSLR